MEASCLLLNLCHSFGRFQEMQNGFHTDKVANNDRVLPSGEGGSGTVHHGSQGGDGTVLPLDGDPLGDGGRGNSCASSRSERAADSGAVRHGPSGFAHKPGVEGVERRDPVQRLRHGSLSVSLTSSESGSRGRGRAHYRGQTDQSPIRTGIRAGAVSAYTIQGGGEHLGRAREGRTGHGPRGHSPQEPFDASLDQAASPGDLPSQHGGAKRRRRKRTNPNTPRTGESFTPSQHDGIGQQAAGLSPVIIRAGTGTGEVPSAGMLGGLPFTPAQKRRCVGTSMLGGRRVLGGVDTSTLEPGARDLSEDPPRHPFPGLGGRVLYIKTILISNAGVWVRLLNYSGNLVCSYNPKMVRIFW
jgi:hypothetical protein